MILNEKAKKERSQIDHIVPKTRDSHAGRFWHRLTAYTFASRDCFAPLVGLLSPVAGKNLFVDTNGRWLGDCIPSCYRAYPFSLAPIKGQMQKPRDIDWEKILGGDDIFKF